jgi:hypothetical protein
MNDQPERQRLAAIATEAPAALVAAAPEANFHATFNFEGHRVIALVMIADLQVTSRETHARVNEILRKGNRTLLDAATFPDAIRDEQPHTKPFHFIDIRFVKGGPAEPPMPNPPNVLSAIEAFTDVLRSPRTTDVERVDALSWLVHLFGDVHQPLHCITRVNQFHPNGDRGGNAFRVAGPAGNLHRLWDSSLDPLGGANEEQISRAILERHPRSTLAGLDETDRRKWARATHRLARRVAYSLEENPAHPPTPSAQYLKTMERHGRRQGALAAYRLSNHFRDTLV